MSCRLVLLYALTYLTRYLMLPQAARLLALSNGQLHSLISLLAQQKFIRVHKGLGLEPVLPAIVYCGGDNEIQPDFFILANKLKRRNKRDPNRVTLLTATRKAAMLTGGVAPNLTRPMQGGHDLSVSEIVIAHQVTWATNGQRWFGEDYLSAHRIRCGAYVPDLGLVVDGEIQRAIDFAAGYDGRRLQKIDQCCRAYGVEYELWG